MSQLLEVKNLGVEFKTVDSRGLTNWQSVIEDVSFKIPKGKTISLVGESGAGKSIASLSIMGLLPNRISRVSSGEIIYRGSDLLQKTQQELRSLRGHKISMIFQEPMTSLNPVFSVGSQIAESLIIHRGFNRKSAHGKVLDLLAEVGIKNPKERISAYPHELSGGQRQRVMIAMAIACKPELLIADEPTTALDVTTQKQILDLLKSLQEKYDMSLLFITHDLSVVGDIADEVVVMYGGKVMEKGLTQQIFLKPNSPYTKGLLSCRPNEKQPTRRLATVSDFMDVEGREKSFDINTLGKKDFLNPSEDILLEVKHLSKTFMGSRSLFGVRSSGIKAVRDVSFKVARGQTLGLVGESGSGKTTLGRTLLKLIESDAGEIYFNGEDISKMPEKEFRAQRKNLQIIFQDPFASLNPRMTVGTALTEPMKIHGIGINSKERREQAELLLNKVGLDPKQLNRYPHEFSGGQRQRLSIARALSVKPKFIICDESVSALDISIQAQILNLLLDLQEEMGLTYIFISHDLGVVRFFSHQLAVMKQGEIVEYGAAEEVYTQPQHEYTKSLLKAIPKGLLKVIQH